MPEEMPPVNQDMLTRVQEIDASPYWLISQILLLKDRVTELEARVAVLETLA